MNPVRYTQRFVGTMLIVAGVLGLYWVGLPPHKATGVQVATPPTPDPHPRISSTMYDESPVGPKLTQ